jgi:hypothetical protein
MRSLPSLSCADDVNDAGERQTGAASEAELFSRLALYPKIAAEADRTSGTLGRDAGAIRPRWRVEGSGRRFAGHRRGRTGGIVCHTNDVVTGACNSSDFLAIQHIS